MTAEQNTKIYDALNSIKTEASYIEKGLPMNQEDADALYDAVRKIKDVLYW